FGESCIFLNVTMRVEALSNTVTLRHEFIKQLHKRYREEGIVIPFPTRSLRMQSEDLVPVRRGPSS
ncbi:MAG TPA: mechanosensitive ion channel family protein, partial [bacterium]|nr:mechanosensitive ion channel family protein [bacterium]